MMRTMIFSTRIAVLLIILAVSSGGASAETAVEHHGTMVDSEGGAAYCLSCHRGRTAMYMPTYRQNYTDRSHKIFMKFPPPEREKDFATLESVLADGIKLESGEVTCISCHNVKNQQRYHFAIETTPYAKRLCYTCHIDIK